MPHQADIIFLEDEIQWLTEIPTFSRARSLSSASTCTIGRNEVSVPIESANEEIGVIDLTIDESEIQRHLLREGEHALASDQIHSDIVWPENFIEVTGVSLGKCKIDFVLVKVIARDAAGQITIRGLPFVRNRNISSRNVSNKLPKKLNEICQILLFDQSDTGELSPAMVDVHINSVVKARSLIVTNALWPKHATTGQFASIQDVDERRRAIEAIGTLVCRWIFKIKSVNQNRQSKPAEEILVRIHETEVPDAQYRVTQRSLRNQWRGGRKLGGSWSPSTSKGNGNDNHSQSRAIGQKYTVFDSFSGAGGVSRGAQMSGFKITHAVDNGSDVWSTYETNFPDVKLFRGSIDEYITAERNNVRADVLHLSPPCQYFSPAHTRMSSNDDANIYALFSCGTLVQKVRPRIITVEQTFGITHDRHLDYLHTLINDFTQLGYSVRWKVVRLCTWGSAQDRKRLVMIAAAPGERLPPFPAATHSEDGHGGLKLYTTMRQALSSVRRGDDLHDLDTVKYYQPPRAPYNPNRLAGTLTTGGSDFCYPDGTRDFTLREYASLQGFPRYHRFVGGRTSVKRQIGNAFPPNSVKVLYQHLEDWLLKEDGIVSYQVPPADDVVVLDGSNDYDGVIIVDDPDESSSPARNSSSPYFSPWESPTMMEFDDAIDSEEFEKNRGSDSITIDLT